MTRKQRRMVFIGTGLTALGLSSFLVLSALQDNLLYFYSPTDVTERSIPPGQAFRLGGLVSEGSVKRIDDLKIEFKVNDGNSTLPVSYSGILPDLFREGQGVVAEGRLDSNGHFVADTVLAKHDENYMPKEVADALKKQGVWQHDKAGGKQAAQ